MMSMPSRGRPRPTPHEPSERAAVLNASRNAIVLQNHLQHLS
jgi:hypothetical protein